jgi:hypothetical protein
LGVYKYHEDGNVFLIRAELMSDSSNKRPAKGLLSRFDRDENVQNRFEALKAYGDRAFLGLWQKM